MNKQKTFHASCPESLPKGRAVKLCHCGQWYSLPACHADRHQSCSRECGLARTSAPGEARKTACAECGSAFIPRPWQLRNGIGKYCSNACSLNAVRRSPEFLSCGQKRIETRRKNYVPRTGPDNPMWTGGQKAAARRRIESGKANEYTRKYRARHPEKVREWRQSRRGLGRLPRGTVKKLLVLQRNCCAFCRASIASGYHVDHIKPLALGGLHEPGNLQLLCPTCNVRKSSIDPIEFAQRNGRLL